MIQFEHCFPGWWISKPNCYFSKNRTYHYIDVLQDIVNSYNATPHSSLNNIAPASVNDDNKYDIWAHMYLKPRSTNKGSASFAKKRGKETGRHYFSFKIGDMVRLSHLKTTFQRSYQQQWSSEIFKIYRGFLLQGLALYQVKDFLNLKISGRFHVSELQSVHKMRIRCGTLNNF